jgi:hypothetical protein
MLGTGGQLSAAERRHLHSDKDLYREAEEARHKRERTTERMRSAREGVNWLRGALLLLVALALIGGGGFALFFMSQSEGGTAVGRGGATGAGVPGGGESGGWGGRAAATDAALDGSGGHEGDLGADAATRLKHDDIARKIQAAHAVHAIEVAKRKAAALAVAAGEEEGEAHVGGGAAVAQPAAKGAGGSGGGNEIDELWQKAESERLAELAAAKGNAASTAKKIEDDARAEGKSRLDDFLHNM